jgi:hypothetical protein
LRRIRRDFLLCVFALVGISLALHFSLHTYGDPDDGDDTHQCPASHINVVHSGYRISQLVSDRVVPDAACATAITPDGAASHYFDEAPVRALVSTAIAPILSARGPPARP